MVDCILYVPDFTALVSELDATHPNMLVRDEGGSIAMPPVVTGFARTPAIQNGNQLLVYARLTDEDAEKYRTIEGMEILAEAVFIGKGTSDSVYQKIKDDPEKLATYEAVHDTAPREVDDGEGNAITYTPPFKFGMLAESALQVPSEITPRQARLVLAKHGLLDSVADAIAAIEDLVQRQIAEIEWEYATSIERSAAWINALSAGLGLSEADVDSLFIEGATL